MDHEHIEKFRILASDKLGLELSSEQLEQFSLYGDLLVEWNQKVNLTNITDPEGIIIKHFIDSLTLARYVNGTRLADIGTGAGFPGVPLKILLPEINVFLVDSLAKRLEFLKVVIDQLNLKGIGTVHSRAEDLGKNRQYRESFDCVTSRAVARLPILLEYAVPLLKVGGIFLAAKGYQVEEEITDSKKALQLLGAEIKDTHFFSLGAEAEHRAIVVVEKISTTPPTYPRKAGTPSKKPLV